MKTNFAVEIIGVGAYMPEKILTNEDLIRDFRIHATDQQIFERIGARVRHAVAPDESSSDLMAKAAQVAMAMAGVAGTDLDCVITCPIPPDAVTPPSSAIVQNQIGAACAGFDLNMSCSGFIAAVQQAAAMIELGVYSTVLVVAGTLMSRNHGVWTNPLHRAIFGDGAGAVILRRSHDEAHRLFAQCWMAPQGTNWHNIFYPMPWSIKPDTIPEGHDGFFMNRREVFFRDMSQMLPEMVGQFWTNTGLSPGQIKKFLIHQPSQDLFLASVEAAGIPLDQVPQNFEKYGNLIAAETPITLFDLLKKGELQRGDWFASLIYGAGYTMAMMAIQIP